MDSTVNVFKTGLHELTLYSPTQQDKTYFNNNCFISSSFVLLSYILISSRLFYTFFLVVYFLFQLLFGKLKIAFNLQGNVPVLVLGVHQRKERNHGILILNVNLPSIVWNNYV